MKNIHSCSLIWVGRGQCCCRFITLCQGHSHHNACHCHISAKFLGTAEHNEKKWQNVKCNSWAFILVASPIEWHVDVCVSVDGLMQASQFSPAEKVFDYAIKHLSSEINKKNIRCSLIHVCARYLSLTLSMSDCWLQKLGGQSDAVCAWCPPAWRPSASHCHAGASVQQTDLPGGWGLLKPHYPEISVSRQSPYSMKSLIL